MMLLFSFLALLFWFGLGVACNSLFKSHKHNNTACVSTIFIGMGLMLHLMNWIQFMSWSIHWLVVLLPIVVVGLSVSWKQRSYFKTQHGQIMGLLVLIFILYLLFLKPNMPMVSWDSWLGWELKARQWLAYGFSIDLVSSIQWLSDGLLVLNLTANYPDGLPLMYYLGQVLGDEQNQVMSYLYVLLYFILIYVAMSRLKSQGADNYVLVFALMLFLSLPLINNHMNLHGYADLMMAVVLLLCVWSLSDWNEINTPLNAFKLVIMFSMLPLFKLEGWVWLALLVFAQFTSKFLISKHRWYLILLLVIFCLIWILPNEWSYSWGGRSVVISQSFIQLGQYFELSLVPASVSYEIFSGLFLQNNWGFLWYFMPFVLIFWLLIPFPKHQQVTQTFFVLSFLAFLFLFFFTGASQWAENYTAVNRIVLQLTPVFAYLVIQVFLVWKKRVGEPTLNIKK